MFKPWLRLVLGIIVVPVLALLMVAVAAVVSVPFAMATVYFFATKKRVV